MLSREMVFSPERIFIRKGKKQILAQRNDKVQFLYSLALVSKMLLELFL